MPVPFFVRGHGVKWLDSFTEADYRAVKAGHLIPCTVVTRADIAANRFDPISLAQGLTVVVPNRRAQTVHIDTTSFESAKATFAESARMAGKAASNA